MCGRYNAETNQANLNAVIDILDPISVCRTKACVHLVSIVCLCGNEVNGRFRSTYINRVVNF